MTPFAVIITIAAYFLVLFGVSHLAGRKADNAGFFIGNRKSSWYVVAFAMIGSSISGVTFMSVPGMVDPKAFSYMQMVLGFFVGQIIISFVLIPLFYKINLFSICFCRCIRRKRFVKEKAVYLFYFFPFFVS